MRIRTNLCGIGAGARHIGSMSPFATSGSLRLVTVRPCAALLPSHVWKDQRCMHPRPCLSTKKHLCHPGGRGNTSRCLCRGSQCLAPPRESGWSQWPVPALGPCGAPQTQCLQGQHACSRLTCRMPESIHVSFGSPASPEQPSPYPAHQACQHYCLLQRAPCLHDATTRVVMWGT